VGTAFIGMTRPDFSRESKTVAPASSPAVLTASGPSETSPDLEFRVVEPRV